MTTVAEAITWDTHQAELESYLEIDSGAESDFIEGWLEDAVSAADQYIGREFIPIDGRWRLKSGIKSGDVFTFVITPDESDSQTAVYTATGDTAEAVAAYALREALKTALAGEAVMVKGAGSVVRIKSTDPDVPFGYSVTYVAGDGTSGILETVKYDSVPSRVKSGVFAYVKAMRQLKNRIEGLQKEKVGAVEHTFDLKSVASPKSSMQMALLTARDYWQPFKANLLGG